MLTVTPNLNFSAIRLFRHFAAQRRWGFFAPATPGTFWTKNVVEPGDTVVVPERFF